MTKCAAGPALLFLLLLHQFTNAQQHPPCIREIVEDICPQREGFDAECDRRCYENFPTRISSGCRTRQTGTLLSFFGIRSFVCHCHLPPIACTNAAANSPIPKHPYMTNLVHQHSRLTALPTHASDKCHAPPVTSFSCRDHFSTPTCAWQLSNKTQWFVAQPNGGPTPPEAPVGAYLAATGHPSATISTCNGLCAKTSVNLTARVWRPPTVGVELCFKEKDATMCAPVHSTNGHLINEIVPETEFFQILFRFSNISKSEMIFVDDLSLSYLPCPLSSAPKISNTAKRIAPLSVSQTPLRNVMGGAQHRMCKTGECETSTIPTISSPLSSHPKMCVGRLGLAYCRQKCNALDVSDSSARCIRQKENPLLKKCICQIRRSPTPFNPADLNNNRIDEPVVVHNSTCHPDSCHASCDPIGGLTGRCDDASGRCECVAERCEESMCNFEKDSKCGWADLRMLSRHFNNISVAMKRGDENRYGISRLLPKSYSGLLYKANLLGPISLSVDIFPSHEIDVRICVQNLRKCQTQTIAARTWNRVSARIKVQTTEKIFVLFYNSSDELKSIAVDNIAIRSGTCSS